MLDELIDYHTLFMTIVTLVGFRYIFRHDDAVLLVKVLIYSNVSISVCFFTRIVARSICILAMFGFR